MIADENPVLLAQDGHVLTITLNRPHRMNALNAAMIAELGATFEKADKDPSVRVIVITGAGKAFCAGADVESLKESAEAAVEEQIGPMPCFTARQCKVFKPTICAVNGVCAGGGLHFVADSDIVIAAESASFLDTHVNVGQVTALEPIGLVRRVPVAPVLRMVILGRAERLDAKAALACTMVTEVLPDDRLMSRAYELAKIAAGVSPAALKKSLKAIWESFELPLSEAYRRGYETLVRHRDHPDAREGPVAFMEKRSPRWTDRA